MKLLLLILQWGSQGDLNIKYLSPQGTFEYVR